MTSKNKGVKMTKKGTKKNKTMNMLSLMKGCIRGKNKKKK